MLSSKSSNITTIYSKVENESLSSSNKLFLLNKIKHKPIILESIFSFTLQRPYILVNFITNDKYLKLTMKNTFDKLKKKNNLSNEINDNINLYIQFKKILEIITKYKEENMNLNKNIDKILQKPSIGSNIFDNENINYFLKKNGVYSILKEKSKLFKNYELLDILNLFEFNKDNVAFLKYLKNEEKTELFLEAIYLADKVFFEKFLKDYFDFKKFPNFTKKYRKYCKIEIEKEILDGGIKENDKFKEVSFIKNILSEIKTDNYKQNYSIELMKYFIFDHLTTFKKLPLYNMHYEKNFDNEYLKYISNLNINQNIELICIIDRFNHSQFIDVIKYPYITSLHFSLFSYEDLDDKFMYYNLPINNIFNIIMNYIIVIQNRDNIKKISFGDEFFINKNQFISYNSIYHQSFISYVIDQYMANDSNESDNVLFNIHLDDIISKEDNLDNIYERYKILYGFNKMFLNLKIKKLLNIKYNEIINHDINIFNNKNKYKIISIDFIHKPIIDLNKAIININSFISNNKDIFINVEILSFNNFNLISDDKTNNENENNNGNKEASSNTFDNLPNLKEFFINNNEHMNNNKITDNEKVKLKIKIKNNNFDYLYLGYDSNNNLIFYRNGASQIKSLDILDLFNTFNKNIVKLNLVYENITIISKKENYELKIINHSNNDKGNYYYYPIKNLSDFIYNYKYCKNLIIEGFDFVFDELKSNSIEYLYINNKTNKICEYRYKLTNENDKYNINEDINLKLNFPKLKKIYIANASEEKSFYKKLLNINMKSKIKINFIRNENKKTIKIDNDNEKINDEYEEEEEEDIYEEENLYDYKFKDEDDIAVNEIKPKKKKFKEMEEEKIICLCKTISYWDLFNWKERDEINNISTIKNKIRFLKRKEIIYFKSNIIYRIKQFRYIHIGLSLLYPEKNICKMKLKLIGDISDGSDLIKKFKNMNHALLIVIKSYNNIMCVYQKDAKGTYLNQVILSLYNSYFGEKMYYTTKYYNMLLEKENLDGTICNEDFSEKFSDCIDDFEKYIDKKEYAELFRIL